MSHPFQLIAVTGKQCAGKDTFFKFYERTFPDGIDVENLKFTGPLYAMQSIIYKLARLEPPEVKDRALLQYLGTDWGRSKDPDVWVRIMKERIREHYAMNDFMVITDTRFPNEAQMIRDMGGKVVKIEADDAARRLRAEVLGIEFIESHPSEMHIDDIEADFILFNDLSLESFENTVKLFVKERI